MNLVYFFLRNRIRTVLIAILLSLLSGFSTAAIISFISLKLTKPDNLVLQDLLVLAAVLLLTISVSIYAKYLLNRITANQNFAMRVEIVDRILATTYRKIELIGAPRLYSLLSEDVRTLSIAFSSIPQLVINLAILLGCLAYLSYLSMLASCVLFTIALPVFIAYRFFHIKANRLTKNLLQVRDKRFEQYDQLSAGNKELMTNATRRYTYYNDHLLPTEKDFKNLIIKIRMNYDFAQACSQAAYFIFLFVLIFLLSAKYLSFEVVTSFALIALYMRSSLGQITGTLPRWAEAKVVLNNIDSLDLYEPEPGTTTSHITHKESTKKENKNNLSSPQENSEIVLIGDNIEFGYESADSKKQFEFGPLSFKWKSGEIVFITGPNGSGKTTFLKVLAQLYSARSGRMTLNGQSIDETNRDWFLNHLSITFADSYLFQDLLSRKSDFEDGAFEVFTKKLQLDDVLSIKDGAVSTHEYSHGQKKRLSLLAAYMDNKSIYVFDEWADNQDPEFKRYFYTVMLPELRAKGKLVIVVSHDDQYFDVADKQIVFP